MYDRKQIRLTWGGVIGSTTGAAEIWQCGMHLADAGVLIDPTLPSVADLGDLAVSELTTFHQGASTCISAGALLKWIRAALVNEAGDEMIEAHVYELAVAVAGGVGASSVGAPPQTSVAVSLWSGSTFGLANYGRFYLPWCVPPVATATGQMVAGNAAAISANAETWLNAVNDKAAGWGDAVRVANLSNVGSGTTKVVTTVRVGSVVDSQRRRRNRLAEAYSDNDLV